MAFSFRLQRLLNLQNRLVKAAEGDLAEAMRQRDEAARMLAARQEESQARGREFATHRQKGVHPWEWNIHVAACAAAAREVEDMSARLGSLEGEVESRRQALMERMREEKTIETLQRKAFERHRQEEEAAERRTLDEVAVTRWNRGALPNNRLLNDIKVGALKGGE